jgi:hypothetical protein
MAGVTAAKTLRLPRYEPFASFTERQAYFTGPEFEFFFTFFR